MKNSFYSGPILIVLAGILWGFSAFTKKIMLAYINPGLLNVINSMCVCLTLVFVWTSPVSLWQTFRRTPIMIICLGFFGTTIGTTMLYSAIDSLSLSVASIVGKLQPVFVIFMAHFLLKERLKLYEILLSFLAVIGACLVALPDPLDIIQGSHGSLIGLFAALASSIGWSISGILGRRLSTIPDPPTPSQLTFFRYFIGSALIIPFISYREYQHTVAVWPYYIPFLPTVFVLAFITVTIPAWAYYQGLKTVSASYASVLELSTPVTGIIMGIFVLNDKLKISQIVGAFLVIISIFLLEMIRIKKASESVAT